MKPVAVLFIENAELQQVGGGGPKFEKGQVYDLAPDQAQRWYSRGKAVPAPAEAVEELPPEITAKIDDVTIVVPPVTEPDVSVAGIPAVPAPAEAVDATAESKRTTVRKGGKRS